MTEAERSVRERIVLAAIECIEREGVQGVTIRGIAREAGVNSAAISYYFGSKEALLETAQWQTLREGTSKALEELDALAAETGDLRAAVGTLLTHLFQGIARYPRITLWHLHRPLVEGEYGGPVAEQWDDFLAGFLARLRPLWKQRSYDEQRLDVAQMWSALLLAGMAPGLYAEFAGVDFREPEDAARFVEHLLARYLPPGVPPSGG